MWLGRNVNVKIELGGKRAIYCFSKKFFNGKTFFNFKKQYEIAM